MSETEHPLRRITGRPTKSPQSKAASFKSDNRMSAEAAGYMELEGAKKDADCHKVNVKGGVSTKLGCCNEFEPEAKTVKEFRCGNCEYVRP